MGRSKDEIPLSNSLLVTAENKLTSLVKNLVKHLNERLEATPTPAVIVEAGKCLDLSNILDNADNDAEKKKSLKQFLGIAKYDEEMKQEILRRYDIFLNSFRELVKEHGQYEEIVKRFAHILFVTPTCHPDCIKVETSWG